MAGGADSAEEVEDERRVQPDGSRKETGETKMDDKSTEG